MARMDISGKDKSVQPGQFRFGYPFRSSGTSKALDSACFRKRLRERNLKAIISQKRLREGKKRRKKGPHYRFDKHTYKKKAAVEQSIGPIKSAEGLLSATKTDR